MACDTVAAVLRRALGQAQHVLFAPPVSMPIAATIR